MQTCEIGVIHGRFQPLHLGHLEYLLAGKSRCRFLYVGITNPDPSLTRSTDVNPHRSRREANPFTYYERMTMVRESLLEAGVPEHDFEIVPFPINYPELIGNYVPLDAVFYVTVYDAWGWEKVDILRSLQLTVDVMWVRTMEQRVTSGSEIRELMRRGLPWEHLVPQAVSRLIHEKELSRRVVEL